MSWLEFLGTCQHPSKSVASKSVSAISEGTESEEEEKAVPKSQCKCDKKISAQSSQIKDLRVKLDGAIAKNMQIRELLNPATLQTVFTNALQASGQFRPRGKFFGKRQDPGITAGIDETTDPDKSCNYCTDMGYKKDNCLHLQKHNAFLASQGRSQERLN